MKLKVNDSVIINSGKDAGKTGKIDRVIRKTKQVIVGGLNMVKKNVKPSKKHPKGGIITKEAPLDISNVSLICSSCGKKTRIKIEKIMGKPRKRICSKCQASLDQEPIKK